MAEDYLTDDEQLEHVKRAVAENWVWVAGGIVLGAALIFGYRYYDGYRNERALRAAAQFDDMTAALQQNDKAKSRQIAGGLIKDFPSSPYADQAQLVLARLFVEEGQLAAAAQPLTRVMNESKDTELRHIARLRLARVLIDAGKPDDALKTLAEDTPGAFAGLSHEVRGDAFRAKKDFKSAMAEYQQALLGAAAGNVDSGLLELKIADLGSPAAATSMLPGAPAPVAAAPPAATPPTAAPPAGSARTAAAPAAPAAALPNKAIP
jgi:predicted negative regulator of RcsB-dependent stress response